MFEILTSPHRRSSREDSGPRLLDPHCGTRLFRLASVLVIALVALVTGSTAASSASNDFWILLLHAQARALDGTSGVDFRQDLVRVVNAYPQSLDAWRLLAWSWTGETENLKEATRIFEGAHTMMPEEPGYANSLLYYYHRTGRERDAETLIESFFRTRGLSPQRAALSSNGPNYSATKQDTEASTEMAELDLPDGYVDEVWKIIEKANQHLAEENYAAALEVYEELVRLNPNEVLFTSRRDELLEVVSHNRFAESYNEAVRLMGDSQWRSAVEKLKELMATDLSPDQRVQAEKLLAEAEEQRRLRRDSGL